MESTGGEITVTYTRYIGILGYDIFDLAVYLSMVIKNLQYNISVADISDRENLLQNQQKSCIYSYKNIDFYRGNFIKTDMNKYDYVLILSEHCDDSLIRLCDSVFAVADNSYAMSEYLKAVIRGCESLSGVIFRDVTDNGIDSGYIVKHIIRDDYLFKLLRNGGVYEIKDDAIDREYKIALGYEGITDFKNLSGSFLKTLSAIALKITGEKEKLIKIALLKAREGKIIEHSILE